MSADVVALVVGTALAVGAVAFVLYPLFFGDPRRPSGDVESVPGVGAGDAEDSAIVALREIEFDRATGKLSESDYAELRNTYGERALVELRASESVPSAPVEAPDSIEARVRAYRTTHRECPTCGLRPEPDAIYCSTCGGYLDRRCPRCAAEITQPSATYCSSCGATLARPRALA